MKIHKTWLLTVCVSLLLAGAAQAELKAGAAKRVVTPDPLLPVSGGVGASNPVKEKKGDLWVRAAVFEQGDTRVAIAVVDFLGWPSVLVQKATERIKSVSADHVMIGSTHTHSAPDPYGFPGFGGKTSADLEYLDRVCTQIAETVDEAAANLKPAQLKIDVGEAEGKIAYNYYAPQLYDPRCGVIQAIPAEGGAPIVTLVNYAIHPEVLGNSVGILSPDLCGPLYDRIEEKTGGMALFVNGAQGGMITADNRDPNGGPDMRVWEECVRIGTLLADEALRIADGAEVYPDPALNVVAETVNFPIDSKLMRGLIKRAPMKANVTEDWHMPVRLNLVDIGPARIFTIPGEALPNIGYYLKRKMNAKYQFLFGLTNDALGYILVPEDFDSFKRYEYISQTSLGEQTGRVLIDNALRMFEAHPAPAK